MITPKDIKPERSLYAIGAVVIKILKKSDTDSFRVDELYKVFTLEYREKVTFNYFSYAIDWLFLLGLVEEGDKNFGIKKCF